MTLRGCSLLEHSLEGLQLSDMRTSALDLANSIGICLGVFAVFNYLHFAVSFAVSTLVKAPCVLVGGSWGTISRTRTSGSKVKDIFNVPSWKAKPALPRE